MFSKQPTFGLVQLPQSSRRSEMLKLPSRAEVVFDRCARRDDPLLTRRSQNPLLTVRVQSRLDLQVSSTAQIRCQCSLIHHVEHLDIAEYTSLQTG